MSEYISELKNLIADQLKAQGYRILPRGPNSFRLLKGGQVVMSVEDKGEFVEMSYRGKRYSYDKWYTKPEHLANVILGLFKGKQGQTG